MGGKEEKSVKREVNCQARVATLAATELGKKATPNKRRRRRQEN